MGNDVPEKSNLVVYGDEPDETRKICVDCSAGFVIGEGEMRWFRGKGFELPKRCTSCRALARAKREQRHAVELERRNAREQQRATLATVIQKYLGETP